MEFVTENSKSELTLARVVREDLTEVTFKLNP